MRHRSPAPSPRRPPHRELPRLVPAVALGAPTGPGDAGDRHSRPPDPRLHRTTQPRSQPTQPASVLVVEDDLHVRRLVRYILERSTRLEVVAEAEDGEAGIAAAEAHQPRLVLLDLRMPKLDGRRALTRLAEASPDSMIAVLTSLDPGGVDLQALFDAGAFAYLEKSVLGPRLAAELDGLLQLHEQPREHWGPPSTRIRR